MVKLLISLLAAIGTYFILVLSICAVYGKLSIDFRWYIWVINMLFIGVAWVLVWCQMNA